MDKASTANYYTHWPAPEALTLKPKAANVGAGDVYSSDVACPSCRRVGAQIGADQVAAAQIGHTFMEFQVWDTGQGTYPKGDDILVSDSGTVRWRVLSVSVEIFGNLYVCQCVKEVL